MALHVKKSLFECKAFLRELLQLVYRLILKTGAWKMHGRLTASFPI